MRIFSRPSMLSTTNPKNNNTIPGESRRAHPRRRILYPTLPAILGEDALSTIATLESEELTFATHLRKSRSQYLHALYLKGDNTRNGNLRTLSSITSIIRIVT
jgi:hypothetical protein